MQEVAPVAEANDPGWHKDACELPDDAYDPEGADWHAALDVAPGALENVPAGQGCGALEPVGQ